MATGPDHYKLAEDLLVSDGPHTGEVIGVAQVHAMLALAAATALASGGRIETDAWQAVAGTRLQDAPAPADGSGEAEGQAGRGDGRVVVTIPGSRRGKAQRCLQARPGGERRTAILGLASAMDTPAG